MNDLNQIPPINLLAIAILGIWGGFVNFMRRAELEPKRNSLWNFISDCIISGGITTVSYLLLSSYPLNQLFAIALSGILGSNSVRFFYLTDIWLEEKLKKMNKDKNV